MKYIKSIVFTVIFCLICSNSVFAGTYMFPAESLKGIGEKAFYNLIDSSSDPVKNGYKRFYIAKKDIIDNNDFYYYQPIDLCNISISEIADIYNSNAPITKYFVEGYDKNNNHIILIITTKYSNINHAFVENYTVYDDENKRARTLNNASDEDACTIYK